MIRIVIIEDETIAARQLERLLLKTGIEVEVVAKIEAVSDAIDQISSIDFDLILMDIHLSDGNAFQIFEAVDIDRPVIFTTAFDSYALKAFRQNSVDYLLKPIALKDLQLSLKRYLQYFKETPGEWSAPTSVLRNLQSHTLAYRERILLQTNSKLSVIKVADISFFVIRNKTVYIQDFAGRARPIELSLAQLEQELDPQKFFRINRSCMLSRAAVNQVSINPTGRLQVQLSSSEVDSYFVSIDRATRFKQWLGY